MKIKKILKSSTVLAASFLFASAVSATTFKVAIGDAAGGTQYELGKAFAASLEKKTDGKLKAQPTQKS